MNARTVTLLVLVACTMAGNGLIVPVLSIYGATFSASATLVGMLITIFGIGRLGANFPTGLAYRRLGFRTLSVAGTGLLLLGAVGAALSTNLQSLLVWRAVQGIGSGFFLTAVGITIALNTRQETRGRFMAVYQGSIHLGAGVGPAVGGVIAEHFGIAAPFWAYAAVSLIAMLVSLAGPTQPNLAADIAKGSAAPAPKLMALWRNPLFLSVCLIAFGSSFTRTAAHWQMIPLLAADRFQMGFDLIGFALTVTSFANVAILPFAGWLVDRLGARFMTPLSTFAFALSLLVIALSPGLPVFWLGMALLGVTGGLVGPAMAASLVESVSPAALAPALGAQRTLGDLGFVLGPVLIGLLDDAASVGVVGGLFANALVVAGTAVYFVRAGRRAAAPLSKGPEGKVPEASKITKRVGG